MGLVATVSKGSGERGLHSLFEALLYVKTNSRARRILEALASAPRRRMYTVQVLTAALGRVNNHDHHVLVHLEALGLIRRYEGHLWEDEGKRGPRVVWNELTPFGMRVLEILRSMEEGDGVDRASA